LHGFFGLPESIYAKRTKTGVEPSSFFTPSKFIYAKRTKTGVEPSSFFPDEEKLTVSLGAIL